MKLKFKLIAALLGLMIAIPGVVIAQNPDDQMPDQDSKPSAGIQAPMQGPNDQGPGDQDSMDQGSMNQGSAQSGSNDQGLGNESSSAPAETNAGVARVSLIHGDVSTQRGDTSSWSAAALNAPVLAGDRVSTGDKARTELQLDYANMLRLAEHSQANITQLTRSQIQIQLGRGMANYSVFKNSDADAEIDTPNVAVRTGRRESSFRILVTADDHTEVLVRSGEVEITTPQGGTRVGQGQFITVQGAGDQAQYKIGEAPARDDWDQWNTDRDNVIRNAVSRRHTNDYYVGAEDLDGHGTWSEVPDYGQVWRPNVEAGWAPYRDGRWVDEPYWGSTWVSYDPWGWAPYHYGRWMMYDGAWAWWPGPAYGYPYYRPIWAPAYVSFYGGGFGFGGGWGSIGWLPLGPCDRFHPWYGRYGGRFGVTGINAYNRGGFAPLHGGTRFSNVNLAMHDRNFRGGTTVSASEFGKGRMSPHPMSHAEFQNAHFTTGRLPVNASRGGFSASGRPAAPSTTRNLAQNQHFFSARGNTATGSNGRSFGNGRPANGGLNNSLNNGAGSRSTGLNNSQSRQEMRGNSNWGSAPRPGNSGSSPSARGNGNSNGGGWQKFSPMSPRASSGPARPEAMGRGEDRSSYSSGSRNAGPVSRGYSSESRGYSGSSRPPLNMRQPIVTQRPYGGDRGGYNGGGRPAPRYESRPAPSYGGGASARPAPSYGGGGGRSAPSYSGGGRSAPSSSGGHSAPSGAAPHGGGGSPHGGGGGSRHGR